MSAHLFSENEFYWVDGNWNFMGKYDKMMPMGQIHRFAKI